MDNVSDVIAALLCEDHGFEKFFHLSLQEDLGGKILVPKLPNSIIEFLRDKEKQPGLENKLEEVSTPRLCMAPTIEGCLNALGHIISLLNERPYLTFHVYQNADKITKSYNWEYLHHKRLVFDAYLTHEIWVLEPIRLRHIGCFRLDKSCILSRKRILPFNDRKMERVPMYHFKFKSGLF